MPEQSIHDNSVVIQHAAQNNLKDVSLSIPKNKLVVFTGVSGSGKSSLVFDTVAAEAQRQLYDMFPLYVRNRLPHYDAPHAELIDNLSPVVVVSQRAFAGDIRSTVGTMTDIAPLLRLLFSRCAKPRLASSGMYSFNDPRGMCLCCSGLGKVITFDTAKMLDRSKSLNEGAILFPGHKIGSYQWQLYANSGLLDPDKHLDQYTEKEWHDFLHGEGVKVDIVNTTGKVWDSSYKLTYEGLLDRLTRLYLKKDLSKQSRTNQKIVEDFTHQAPCPECGGARLNEAARTSLLYGKTIMEVSRMEIGELRTFLRQIGDPAGRAPAERILHILDSIDEMGLGYLSLDREAPSLSGGEAQRLKIVRHLESSLTGLTYIFDEPTAGLHPKDVERLIRLFNHLKKRGNTVYVVEHNPQIIAQADEVIELGPQAGVNGGEVIFQGTLDQLKKCATPTGLGLRQPVRIKAKSRVPKERQMTLLRGESPLNDHPSAGHGGNEILCADTAGNRGVSRTTGTGFIEIKNAALHNLKNVSVRIPAHALTVVTGVAGSGKSSLICGELLSQHPEIIHISQSPVGKTPRATPATYTGILDEIRKQLAAMHGADAALFSNNSKGACPACGGRGVIRMEMAFMDTVEMVCETCGGHGYCAEALQFTMNGRNIVEMMRMTVDQAFSFFTEIGDRDTKNRHKTKSSTVSGRGTGRILQKLKLLRKVGMGYMTLGQPLSTLSGGECQRLKLASHIGGGGKNSIYVMDEPSAGLHMQDIRKLLKLLNELVEEGNTVILIEHNLAVAAQADWLIDMGPDGGKCGGEVLYQGIPAGLTACGGSYTAEYLRRAMQICPGTT